MITFLEYINESFEVNESLKSSLLKKVATAVNKKRILRRGLASISNIDWDKITDDMFVKYNGETAKKAVNKVISNIKSGINGIVIICMKNEDEPDYVVNSNKRLIDLERGTTEIQNTRADILWYAESAKAVYVLDNAGHETWSLQLDRRKTREGAIDSHDPEQLRRIAQANMERYKKILAKNRALRDDDTATNVQGVMNEVMDFINRMSVDLTKYSKVSYQIEQLMQMTYGHNKMDYNYKRTYYVKGLLQLFTDYMSAKAASAQGNAYSFQIETVEKNKNAIVALIDTIKSKMNEIESASK